MEKEKVMHVLSVLLDEITKGGWTDSIMGWTLSGGDDDLMLLTLSVYERYVVTLYQLTELADKFEIPYKIDFRTEKGVLEIRYTIKVQPKEK